MKLGRKGARLSIALVALCLLFTGHVERYTLGKRMGKTQIMLY